MVRSSIRLTPAQRRDAVASEVAALCATGAQYRRALHILAQPEVDKVRRMILACALLVALVAFAAALVGGMAVLYGAVAAALAVVLVGHCVWFQDWS